MMAHLSPRTLEICAGMLYTIKGAYAPERRPANPSGNTTLLIGVDDAKLQGTLDIIEKVCKSRKQMAASPTPMGGASNVYTSFPMEVTVGGATVFVLTVDQFMKL